MLTSDFEQDIIDWYDQNVPHGWHEDVDQMSDDEFLDLQRAWLKKLNTRGFAAPGVPTEWGGGGYSASEQASIFSVSARFNAPPIDIFEVSLNHVPSTFLAAGSEEQREAYIRQAIEGTVWCQGFSEPGAGSDLARLSTRAVRDGDGWRVTGQKIWSSHASKADFCLLLVRSDPNAPRRQGITYFAMDMKSPGVTVRPIQQIHGPSGFCEIFLDDVFIPDENVIGEVNDGWHVAQSTLAAERGPLALPTISKMGLELRRLLAQASEEAGGIDGPLSALESEFTELLARQMAIESMTLDTVDLMERSMDSGFLASLIKTSFSELLQTLSGAASLHSPEESLLNGSSNQFLGYVSGRWMVDWLGSWSATIAGGANEVQRDIIAERILGLPRESAPAQGGTR